MYLRLPIMCRLAFSIFVLMGLLPEMNSQGVGDFDHVHGYDLLDPDEEEGKEDGVAHRSFANPCYGVVCMNGGTCTVTGNGYICDCVNGFTGYHCETPRSLNPVSISSSCYPNPCHNGGICNPYPPRQPYYCTCTNSFTGPYCSQPTYQDICSPNPCMNNGRCIRNGNGGYTCACGRGYGGAHCEIAVTSCCTHGSCLNGGTCACKPDGISYMCYCPTGFRGERCEITVRVGHCSANPCMNGGICTEMPNTFYCTCPQQFTGRRCDSYITPPVLGVCQPNPCHGDCSCIESCRHSSGYYCQSPTGYLGKNCTVPPPTLRCEENAIIITVDNAFLLEYEMGVSNAKLAIAQTADLLTQASQQCQALFDGVRHTFTLHLPFTQCGTRVDTREGGRTVFINNIWLNRLLGGGFDMPVPVICFECSYEKEYSIVSSVQPAVDQPQIYRTTGVVHDQGTIELCKVSHSCPNVCPTQYAVTQGAVYTVGETLHLTIRQPTTFQGIVALQSLYLSCEVSSNSNPVVTLVSNGCLANTMPTVVSHSGLSSAVCASFQVPKLTGCTTFYIHARLESCASTGCTMSSLMANCYPGRKRREVEEKLKENIVDIYGPIYVIDGSPGIPSEILFPNLNIVNYTSKIIELDPTEIKTAVLDGMNRSPDPPPKGNVKTSTVIALVAAFGIVAAATLIALFFVSRKEGILPCCRYDLSSRENSVQ